MNICILIFVVLNIWTIFQYSDFMIKPPSYRKKFLIDFIGPFGSILGRLIFGYKFFEYINAVIFGLLFQVFIVILSIALL